MKKVIYFLFVSALFAACTKEPHYLITGKISGADGVIFVLQKRVSGQTIILDSARVVNGKFQIKGGAVDYPEIVTLLAKDKGTGFSFYLENTNITITGNSDSLDNVKISGSKTQDELVAYTNSQKPLEEKYNKAYEEYLTVGQSGDNQKTAEIEKQMANIENEMTIVDKDFVKNNPSSYVAPSILNNLAYYLNAAEIEEIINAMDTLVAKSPVIQSLKSRVEIMKSVAIGKKAPEFTMNDVNGIPVTLSSKIGSKLLLVDFWAGWCGPCRQENPNLVKVFNEFNKKGFNVLGVSLDRTKEEWLKAIADDKLAWTHVSDLQYWNSPVAQLYGVNAIPSNFLLDENGVIIGRNLRGEDLLNKVKEILGTN